MKHKDRGNYVSVHDMPNGVAGEIFKDFCTE